MPLYEYQCETCGAVFEKMQRFSDEPLTVHEGCGGPVHRLLSAPALQFKGTGWYVTDYARGKSGSNGGSHSKSNSESKPASSSSSDSSSSTSSSSPSKPSSSDK
ncbi:MAG: zinc ribbon domain-containing protein [Acidobacteria bacterium]|nr:zinc ribbon domain-containing protein [Acidobacteriota bacterium]